MKMICAAPPPVSGYDIINDLSDMNWIFACGLKLIISIESEFLLFQEGRLLC